MKRTEYPRPQFVRREWQCLNGSWEFAFDDENRAQADHWELDSFRPEGRIEVPFCFESKLSGIGDTSIHDHVFYKRNFTVPEEWKGRRVLLHFEAVDYSCRVFVNEKLCTEHTGGNAGFCADITDYLRDGEQTLAVAVYDPAQDETIPGENSSGRRKAPISGIRVPQVSGRVYGWSLWSRPISPV